MTTGETRPDRSSYTTILTAVVIVGVALLAAAVLGSSAHRIVGAVVFLLGIAPLEQARRTQPEGIGRAYLGRQLGELIWFLVMIAFLAAGLLIFNA